MANPSRALGGIHFQDIHAIHFRNPVLVDIQKPIRRVHFSNDSTGRALKQRIRTIAVTECVTSPNARSSASGVA